jgi:hypothetical protein
MAASNAPSAAPSEFGCSEYGDSDSTLGKRTVGKRRKVADGNFCDNIDEGRAATARKIVTQAIKDPQPSLRLQFVIERVIAKDTTKRTGDMASLPPCSNKYHLIGKDRSIELFTIFNPAFDKAKLQLMKKADVDELQDFVLALHRPCAVPAKIWGALKQASLVRYTQIGDRAKSLVLVERGDAKSRYVEIDWEATGAYAKNFKGSKKDRKIVSLTHVSGDTVKLVPPLDDSYRLTDNHNDWKAKFVSDKNPAEVLCWKVFEKAGKLDVIPKFLEDSRVGMPTPSPTKKPQPLALTNQPWEDITAEAEGLGGPSISSAATSARQKRAPPGEGSGAAPQVVKRRVNGKS